ncbi:MAG: LytR C-terminal domain-containing protein [Acidimicrobiales bacterium]
MKRGESARVHLAIWSVLFVLAAVSIPVLGYIGVRSLLDSRDGEVINPVEDPTQPGYQALVSPSPTLLVVHTGPAGELVGAAVLALAGEGDDTTPAGGSVLLVPPPTVVDVPEIGPLTLGYVHAFNGLDATVALTEIVLRMGIDDVVELRGDDWARLVEPLGALPITNPDELRADDGSVAFAAGPLELASGDVGAYLEAVEGDESPLNRVLRQELVWDAWLTALDGDPGGLALGGEQDQGLARFLPELAGGTHRIATLPGQLDGLDDPDAGVAFTPDEDAVDVLIPQLVPFPSGARSGDRLLVRVLDGSGRPEVVAPAVRRVASGGGQVTVIGNADRFGEDATRVIIASEGQRDAADAVVEALGVGSVQVNDQLDEDDAITVILGSDFVP